jgi:hypothetical protein
MAYHVRSGQYGEASLDGLNVLGLVYFKGNIWAGETKASIGLFFDEKANPKQREALQMIFSGKAGGFMAEFAKLIENVRGMEYAPIRFELSDDLSRWSAEIPGKVVANSFSLANIPAGVYTLDIITQKGNTRAAYEGILVIGQQPTTAINEITQNLINQEINQNTRVDTDYKIVFRDSSKKENWRDNPVLT